MSCGQLSTSTVSTSPICPAPARRLPSPLRARSQHWKQRSTTLSRHSTNCWIELRIQAIDHKKISVANVRYKCPEEAESTQRFLFYLGQPKERQTGNCAASGRRTLCQLWLRPLGRRDYA